MGAAAGIGTLSALSSTTSNAGKTFIAPSLHLTLDSGTQASPSFPSCTGFSAETTLFGGTLGGFAATHSSFANGLSDNPGTVATKWASGDTVVYRITATLADNNLAQGTSSGAHTFTWEAQNQ